MTVPDVNDINVILTFEDEATGAHYMAAASMGPLVRKTNLSEQVSVEDMKDRVFVLVSFKIVTHEEKER